jgi:protein involved in polysaccharide export with SLBB domain
MATRRLVCGFTALLLICFSSVSAQQTRRATAVTPNPSRPAQPGARPAQPAAPPDSGLTESTTFRPGDTFEISVGAVPLLESDAAGFTKPYTIGGDGLVNIPYAGLVRAAGLTQSQLEKAIQTRLIEEKIFRWPTITIIVQERARLITVGGQVRAPQRIFWTADMTLMSALNAAGGPADFAGDKIRLTRNQKNTVYSRKRLLKNPDQDPKLFPGDQIEVL